MFADVFNYHIFTLVIDTFKTKNIYVYIYYLQEDRR